MAAIDSLAWLRTACAGYRFEPVAVFRDRTDPPASNQWPLTANDQNELVGKLRDLGYFLPLPREPAALANVIEVSVSDFLAERAAAAGIGFTRGRERSYPDFELHGPAVNNEAIAVDIKVARRKHTSKNTESRITLYTGNTYFKYDSLAWPGNLRPFADYGRHLDVIILYSHGTDSDSGVSNVEIIVQEAWTIASRQRSSTTREYIGAVRSVEALRAGKGEFKTQAEFYKYWRAYGFKVGRAVSQQLEKALKQAAK
ncbi:restriction endonuclease [Sphingomonas sp. C8-2]|nr:restriction endonuclease [Sphingomonas sp. C8-2]